MTNRVIVSAIVLSSLASVASAHLVQIGPFQLSGLQENPANASPAVGSATLTLDTHNGSFTLDYSFSGLLGTVTVAHFHNAAAGSNGGVVYWLAATGAPNTLPTTLLSPSLPTGVNAGSGTGTGTLSSTLMTQALAGRLYVNIHTTSFAGGEIRGQVVPTTGVVSLAGLAGLASLRRRRA
jgi:MYXO-CTERM domain-containing protein